MAMLCYPFNFLVQAARSCLDLYTAKLGDGDELAQAHARIGVEVHQAMLKALSESNYITLSTFVNRLIVWLIVCRAVY